MHNSTEHTVAPQPWSRVKWTRAGQLVGLVDGLDDLPGLEGLSPAAAFATLRTSTPALATRFLAQSLQRMDAVFWLLQCLETAASGARAHQEALAAIRRWANDPSDKTRRYAFDVGESMHWSGAEAAGCLAVFLSGGSIAPPEQEIAVPPAPGAFGQAISCAVLMAANRNGPSQFAAQLSRFLDIGAEIAAGKATPEREP